MDRRKAVLCPLSGDECALAIACASEGISSITVMKEANFQSRLKMLEDFPYEKLDPLEIRSLKVTISAQNNNPMVQFFKILHPE